MKEKKFVQISCPRCQKVQILFGKSSYEVKCSECNYLLTKSTGGKAKIRAKVKSLI
ncbi:30S ribosomal protein S27e [Candidatus Pacearchaeota archaeon CG10_big_fil_rev_8_21_14_0_10_31_24]|nr:MAG: 30S ribosomal protein S27e [Candidatus Pacearchaeota archaeon CG10_big_fil_rev_8_21_14_0_10_31_24]